MDLTLTDDQRAIDEAVRKVTARFDDAYWLERDRTGDFPLDFHAAMAAGGWLGIAMPEEFGGAGLGVTEAVVVMHAVANGPGAMAAASSIHMNIFGPHAITLFGTKEQQARWLPPLIEGRTRACFAVTEPDAGLDTTNIRTRAVRKGDRYIVDGRKIWTSTAQIADKVMLLARTTAKEDAARPTDGLSLFYTDLDRAKIEVRRIPKMGRHAVDSNELFIDGLEIPAEDRIGPEGSGFRQILHSMNPERLLVGAEAIAIGRHALDRAVQYAGERVVFGRPIGQNQAIQHPLAECWMALQAAWLMALHGARLCDAGQPCGAEANAAKYLGAEAGFRACERAVMTMGGMGYAKEFHVERLLREVMIPRLVPVSAELILCHIAERVLGLPKSY